MAVVKINDFYFLIGFILKPHRVKLMRLFCVAKGTGLRARGEGHMEQGHLEVGRQQLAVRTQNHPVTSNQ